MYDWIMRHASWIKVAVWLVFAAWLVKPVACKLWHYEKVRSSTERRWYGRFADLDQDKLKVFKAEIAEMRDEAKAKGENYGFKAWLYDYARIYDMADTYDIPHEALMGTWNQQILGIDELHRVATHNSRYLGGTAPESETCDEALYSAQVRLAVAMGDPVPRPPGSPPDDYRLLLSWLPSVLLFLLAIYLKMMLFCFVWYPLRLIDPWHSGGRTKLREELVFAPGRFIKAVVLWPVWFKVYGRFTSPAKAVRYARLKVEYLRQKSGAEQLLPHEEEMLRRQVEQPLEDFERALARLKTQEQAVKRSLVAAAFWFLIGLFLSPFVSPRSRVHQGMSICARAAVQLILESAQDYGAENNKSPPCAPFELKRQAIVDWPTLPERPLRFSRVQRREPCLVLKEVIQAIDHVPRRYGILRVAHANGGCY